MSKRQIRIAIGIFILSFFLFTAIVILMCIVSINGVFQISGKLNEQGDRIIFEFDILESHFYGYEIGDEVEISVEGKGSKCCGIIVSQNEIENIDLSDGDVYHYKIQLEESQKSKSLLEETEFLIPTREKKTIIEIIYSQSVQK